MCTAMVTSKETRAAIINLHENGLTCKEIATKILHLKEPFTRSSRTSKREFSTAVKKSSGRPRVSSKRQDRLLLRSQLWNRVTTSAELAQEWQQVGVRASYTVRPRLLDNGLVSRKAAKEPLLSKKNVKDRLKFCRKYNDWTAEDWCKVIFSNEAPFRLFGTSGKSIVQRRKGERYHESCVVSTVKHPETIHVWGCFSTKGVGSFIILSKNTARNKEWFQNVLQERLLPTIHKQFGDDSCIFQHDGAPCHKARSGSKIITFKFWIRGQANPQISIPLRTCGHSSKGEWTSRSPQIVINYEN
uniref:Transposase Tc1-like domain-containing protein n=1 Tax=Cyprinus carpio carpio TaxID=630221 RepID=A0A9J8C147_CYPCA